MDSSLKDQIDFYVEFKDWYFKIIEEFGFSYQTDCEARNYLSGILNQKDKNWNLENILYSFSDLFQEKNTILIYGCGPSLEETVDKLLRDFGKNFFKKSVNLAADGASVLLREKGIPIGGIFSDLDGITKTEFNYTEFLIIHAHGDNLDKLAYFKEDILGFSNIIGTTQVEPLDNIINPGGFTDGDRILFFIRAFLHPRNTLLLIGMDFNEVIGKYSKPSVTDHYQGTPIKVKKLRYAVKLIEWLTERINNKLFFINSKFVSNKFSYLTVEELNDILKSR